MEKREDEPSPLPDKNDCLDLSKNEKWGLTSNNDGFDLVLGMGDGKQTHAIYTDMPKSDFDLDFAVTIKDIYVPKSATAEYLEIGIVDLSDRSKDLFRSDRDGIDLRIGHDLLSSSVCEQSYLPNLTQTIILSVRSSALTFSQCPDATPKKYKYIDNNNRELSIGWYHNPGAILNAEVIIRPPVTPLGQTTISNSTPAP